MGKNRRKKRVRISATRTRGEHPTEVRLATLPQVSSIKMSNGPENVSEETEPILAIENSSEEKGPIQAMKWLWKKKDPNGQLKNLPQSSDELLKEACKLGMGASMDTGSMTPRQQLLANIYASKKIGRCPYQASILLCGSSGVGKSSTINNLFNLTEGGKAYASVSANTSETRETTEYVIKSDYENRAVEDLTLGIVDTPGFKDTDGMKQDASNFYSIKRFYASHPKMKGHKPNLIFILIKASDSRIIGANSDLEVSLKCLNQLDVVDTVHPNVVGIITRASSFGRKASKFDAELQKKSEIFSDCIYRCLSVTAPIVPVENDLEELDEVGEYFKFVNGDLQPKNLYLACEKILSASNDDLGLICLNACFVKPGSISQGYSVVANDAKDNKLDKDEEAFFEAYQAAATGGVKDLFVAKTTEFIKMNKLSDNEINCVKAITATMKRNCLEMHDLKLTTMEGISFLSGIQIGDLEASFLSHLGVQKRTREPNEILDLLGQGYNVLNDKTVSALCFTTDSYTSPEYGLKIPIMATTKKKFETKFVMDKFVSIAEYRKRRARDLGISLDVDLPSANGSLPAGYNVISTEGGRVSDQNFSLLWQHKIFDILMGNFDITKMRFTADFLAAVKKLPDTYNKNLEDSRSCFETFFHRFGHFLVTQVSIGGSFEMQMNNLASNFATLSDSQETAEASFGKISMKMRGYIEQSNSSNTDLQHILAMSNITFSGGSQDFHQPNTISKPDMRNKWICSVVENPVVLRHEQGMEPISTLVGLVDEEKEKPAHDALKDFLGGEFFTLRKKEEKEREREEKEAQKKADEIKRQAEEESRDNTVKDPKSSKKCLSLNEKILVLGKGVQKVSSLSPGDRVLTWHEGAPVYSPVLLIAHLDTSTPTLFLKIHLDSGDEVSVTQNHLLIKADGSSTMASQIHIGDQLLNQDGVPCPVDGITRTVGIGYSAPITEAGTLLAGGVLVSCYSSVNTFSMCSGLFSISGHKIAHLGLLPYRMYRTALGDKYLKKIHKVEQNQQLNNGQLHPYIRALSTLCGIQTD